MCVSVCVCVCVRERNYSSNVHHVCCADSQTKGLYDHCQSVDFNLHSRSQVGLKLDYVLACNISDNILSYYIQTWHDGRLMDALYAHARFDGYSSMKGAIRSSRPQI